MEKIAIFYGSDTGNTEAAAKQIASLLDADIFDVASDPVDKLADYTTLIFGTSTMGIGDLQSDWEYFISKLENSDLKGKKVALFGLGDSDMYPDSFVDGMGTIYNTIKDKGCRLIGQVDTDGYDFDESTAIVDDEFVGLALDDDNQSDMTEERIHYWVEQLKKELT